MQLIIILIALFLGRMTSRFDHLRRFNWFQDHVYWLEKRVSNYGIWNSAIGVLLPLLLPCIILLVVLYALNDIWSLLGTVFSVLILFVCLKREALVDSVYDFIEAHKENDQVELNNAAAKLTTDISEDDSYENRLLDGLFSQSLVNIFGVIFWFMVLGPLGAFIYKLSQLLYLRQHDIHGGFTDSVKNLNRILNWPVTQLTVLTFALVGSLSDTLKAWQQHDSLDLASQQELLVDSARAAIQYMKLDDVSIADWLDEALGLVNRGLVLWLVVIAFSTIQGWLS